MEKQADNVAWDLPQRQSPAAIFILLWSTSLKVLKGFWPVLVLYFFKGEKNENSISLLLIVLIFALFSLSGTIISYWFKKFYVLDDTLVIKSGWLKKKILSIPFQNIQAVHLEQNVWQRFLGVSKVSFDATGSEKVEVQLEALPTSKAEALKDMLAREIGTEHAATIKSTSARTAYKLNFPDVIKLSLTANHVEAFLILVALGFNLLDEIKQIFDINGQDFITTYADKMISQSIFFIGFVLTGVAIISVLFSAIRTIIRFYGFQLVENDSDWKISYGLFNREQKTIPLKKIQILSWRANWIRRKFNYWIMHVQSVGYKSRNRKQNLQIPVMDLNKAHYLAKAYQQKDPDVLNGLGIEPDYWKRKLLFTGVPVTVISIVASMYWLGGWSVGFVLLFIYLAFYFYRYCENFEWFAQVEGIQIISGAWGRNITLLNWKKIQQIHIHQSIYQRNHNLANVVFITAGGRVVLPYLTLATARALVDQVLYDVESKNEPWM